MSSATVSQEVKLWVAGRELKLRCPADEIPLLQQSVDLLNQHYEQLKLRSPGIMHDQLLLLTGLAALHQLLQQQQEQQHQHHLQQQHMAMGLQRLIRLASQP
jgi:cell division protein ZapA (FtsZ GTPase activity inhibitor)